MAPFDDTIKEEIRSRIDIVSVIGRYVNLKQAGATLKGLCPFHKEKTPSFQVNPARGFFHCFGCGKGGDVFKFVEEVEGIAFFEALTMLGEECGVEVKPQSRNEQYFNEEGEDASPATGATSKTELFRIHEIAAEFFYKTMRSAPDAVAYLKSRGLLAETVRDFRLGYAGDAWTSLTDYCKALQIDEALLVACGLAVQKENGRVYDRFRNRVIFPLNDISGRVIGFAGRGMTADIVPKYLNSPETLLYKKKHFLYGLYRSRQAIKVAGRVLVVEGYMDYLSLVQAGVENVVASSGTALTPEHGKLIGRFTRNVVLLFDGDAAGQSAIEKAIFTLAPFGLDVATLSLPGDDDPDSFIRKQGKDAFIALLKTARPWSGFIIDKLVSQHNGVTPAGKSAVVQALQPLITAITDPIILQQFIKEVSQKLDLPERLIQGKSAPVSDVSPDTTETVSVKEEQFITTLEGTFLHILVARPEFIAEAQQYVHPETLTDGLSADIYSLILQVYERDQSLAKILDGTSRPEIRKLISFLMVKAVIEDHIHEELVQKIIYLRKKYLRSRQRECKILLKQDPHRREELLRLLQDYMTQLHELDGGE